MKNRYIVFVLTIVIFIAAIFFVLASSKKKTGDKKGNIPAVVVEKPIRGNLDQSISISGYVEASVMIPVVPFVSGTIISYNAKPGEFVKKNTVLALIDNSPFTQQMLQAQASYLAAKSTFERVEILYQEGAATQQSYDSAKAQRDASKAQYDLAMLQVNYSSVKAPVDGTILIADQAVGGIGNQSTPIAVMADLQNQVVRLKVPEKYFDLFNLQKQTLKITVVRPGEKGISEDATTGATILTIAPFVSPQSKNFEVVCHLDDPGERFRPGMFVKVNVAYNHFENVPLLPIETKKMDGSVYTYNPNEKTVHYFVPNEIADDGNYFIVDESLADEYFVIDGQNFIFDGQTVVLMEDALEAL